ncbi:MAG: helix-turn-helix domain-containing protein [Betaproteobacteria bacterium]
MSVALSSPYVALDLWRFAAREHTAVQVAPDGCRDLIVVTPRAGAPTVFVSALADATAHPQFAPGDHATGVRLRPGARVDEAALLALVRGGERIDDGDLMNAIGAGVELDARVSEALECLREASPLALAQRRLGVSERSLERLLSGHTQRGPLWWRNLARARRCARALAGTAPLVHVAAAHGYADQAHMTRDLRRWFGAPPTRLRAQPAFLAMLAAPAYA